jgi:hypothetical protein
MTEPIQNPWCIRKGVMFNPIGMGKIESEDKKSAYVRYSEGQLYLPEVWGNKYLERFATFQEMVEKFAEYEGTSIASEMKRFFDCFPSLRVTASENT